MTKREKHRDKIKTTLYELFGVGGFRELEFNEERYGDVADAILNAIEDPPPKRKAKGDGGGGRLVKLYCDLWRARYNSGQSPPVRPKHAGQLKAMMKDLGEEKVSRYMEAYFQMPDAWFVKARHPVELFVMKLNEVADFAASGRFISNAESRKMDQGVSIATQMDQIDRGEI